MWPDPPTWILSPRIDVWQVDSHLPEQATLLVWTHVDHWQHPAALDAPINDLTTLEQQSETQDKLGTIAAFAPAPLPWAR